MSLAKGERVKKTQLSDLSMEEQKERNENQYTLLSMEWNEWKRRKIMNGIATHFPGYKLDDFTFSPNIVH